MQAVRRCFSRDSREAAMAAIRFTAEFLALGLLWAAIGGALYL